MGERGERYQEGRPKENFPETFPARALMLEMDKEEAFHIDSKPGGKYDQLRVNTTNCGPMLLRRILKNMPM